MVNGAPNDPERRKTLPVAASMTGFAARRGEAAGRSWVWEVRSVNGKGLDLRTRLPEGIDGLEPAVRSAVARVAQRGNVSVALKLSIRDAASDLAIDEAALAAAVAALKRIEDAALTANLSVAAATPAEILGLRGVLASSEAAEDNAPLLAALLADLDQCLSDFAESRQAEGRALVAVISAQIGTIARLQSEATAAAEARRPQVRQALEDALARVVSVVDTNPDRIAQELALMAVKSDVTEELDRLGAHVDAAVALLSEGGAIGRKLDFLMQEFMREANTLCSKSGDRTLTRIGLDLKTVIDQMREQVQNVE